MHPHKIARSLGTLLALGCLLGGGGAHAGAPRLSDNELQSLAQQRDAVRGHSDQLESRLKYRQAHIHAANVARLAQRHMLLSGEPGASKTGLFDAHTTAERERVYKIVMNEMTPTSAILGGEVMDEAEHGKYVVNTKDSLVDHQVATVDELEKAQPSVLGSMLPVMSDREARLGHQIVPARTETIFAATNATLAQVIQMFVDDNRPTTGPAFVNRFQIKGYAHDMLPREDMVRLVAQKVRAQDLKAQLALGVPGVAGNEQFAKPTPIDYATLGNLLFGKQLMIPHDQLVLGYAQLAEELRKLYRIDQEKSEGEHRASPKNNPFVYYPSVKLNTRIVAESMSILLASAFVDFLRSPLADDKDLEHSLAKPIVLGVDSLWRAHLAMTTVGMGDTRLVRSKDPAAQRALGVDFGWVLSPTEDAGSEQAAHQIKHLNAEHAHFSTRHDEIVRAHQAEIEDAARFSAGRSRTGGGPFELSLLRGR